MKKLVSIIIPVYNSEKYIGQCIDSFLSQTYQNIELILIDDGSKDNSLSILKSYQEMNQGIVFVYSQENEGVASTRNKGVSYAHGEYIMFADNDDYVEKDYVEIMLSEIEHKKADMIVGSCRKVDGHGNVLYEQKLTEDEWSKFRVIAPWARIMRRQFIIDKNIKFGDFKLGEDSFFTVTAYNESNNIYISSYIGYNWVQRETSVSNTIQKKGNVSPIPFLSALVKRNERLVNISNEYFEYFVIKFIVWNLYYICDDVERTTLLQCCREYFEWLRQCYPKYKKNYLVHPFRPKGEEFSVRVLVWIMVKVGNREKEWVLRIISILKKHLGMRK